MLKKQWESAIRGFNNFSCVPEKEWEENTKTNMKRLHASNSIWNLDGLFDAPNDKALIVVGASPILNRDIHKLKNLDRKDFCIVCVNSALKILMKAGVKPDYVICIDSDEEDICQHLDVDSTGIQLITCNSISPKALDAWKGPVWFFPYLSVSIPLRKKLRNRLGTTIPTGGNALGTMIAIGIKVFHSRIIVLVASECCYTKNYYPSKKIPRNNKQPIEFYETDINGNKRLTTQALHTYKIWIERLALEVHPIIKIIDTSEGLMGKRDEKSYIYTYELSEIIGKIKEASDRKREMINADPSLLNAPLYPPGYRWKMHRSRSRVDVRDSDPACRPGSAGFSEVRTAQNDG